MPITRARSIGAALTVSLAAMGTAALGQDAADPFGSFQHDNTQPIEITADSLEVRDNESRAIFAGEVIAGQGDLRLTADTVSVWYIRDGGGGDTGAIERLRAEGDVFLSSGSETATGAWAEYAVVDAVVTMGGGVTLAQGENAISGERLQIDLNSGIGSIDGGRDGGRVRTVFNPAETQGQ